MIIRNAKVYTEDGTFEEKDIFIEKGIFTNYTSDSIVIDAKGLYAVPGLTDIHLHGCNGHDFCEGTDEALSSITQYEALNGITTIVPASMTLPEESLECIYANTTRWNNTKGAEIKGIYMEGPFVSQAKKGAQNPEYIKSPNNEMFERLVAAAKGLIKFVAIAPETDGALEFIKKYKSKVVMTIAHTDADYAITTAAIEAGAGQLTHLYNAMNPIHHREPGPVIAAADADDVMVEMICDGVHVHEAMVRSTFKLFSRDRIIFVSDSMMATGMPDGEYELGGQAVTVKGKHALLADGTIAGSVTNLMDCVRTAVKEMKISLEDAIWCAAVNPAKAVGIYSTYGSITQGKIANLILLDKELEIVNVYQRDTIY